MTLDIKQRQWTASHAAAIARIEALEAALRQELTVPQMQALLTAAGFLLSGEWGETISATEKNTLDRATEKLRAALAPGQVNNDG